MTPFVWKKTIALWLIYYGNAYIWQPVQDYHELFILGSNRTWPQFDKEGNLWYRTFFPSGKWVDIPAVEVTHLMINSINGLLGRSVISYARETIGRQLGAQETQNRLNGSGLNPSAILWVNGELNQEARDKIRSSYTAAVTGSGNAGNAAIFDNTISKFEAITMKPSDAQFLESMQATDAEVANFFGLPLYKLNMGKQSYESNSAQQLDYLATTLNPYLVQWEQAARMKWLPYELQDSVYFRFIREALLQTDAKTRSEYLREQIMSGQMTPNEARSVNDMSAYDGGDLHFIPANMAAINEDGSMSTLGQVAPALPVDPNSGGQE
jgi:HK97 family phage portal protein